MRRLILPLIISVLAVPHTGAATPCDHAVAPHGVALVAACDIAGTGVILVVGDHQSADCPRSDGNVIVIIGDDNHVRCDDAFLTNAGSECEGEPYAIQVSGEAHSCGVTIVLLGSGSGRIAVVGLGKAEGGTVAVVGHGCATQNEEGIATGIVSNACGRAILPPADDQKGAHAS